MCSSPPAPASPPSACCSSVTCCSSLSPRGGSQGGRKPRQDSRWTSALPLNFLFPGQWAAATGSGLCPSLPGPGPAGPGPIWTTYVPPLPSQQPPGPSHPPATPSFIPVSCVSFRKHPGDPHLTSPSPPPSSLISLLRSPCLTNPQEDLPGQL